MMANEKQPAGTLGIHSRSAPASPLSLSLRLSRSTCIRGESVFFELSLTNTGSSAVDSVRTFSADNESTLLLARRLDADPSVLPRSGDGASLESREGSHVHGSTFVEAVPLPPGQSIRETGDVLQWLGELEQGTWEVWGEHEIGAKSPARSPVVTLTIEPAEATRLASVGPSLRSGLAPVLSAWRHGPGGILFHQVLSPRLPRVAYRCVRIGEGVEDGAVYPSSMVDAGTWSPHILLGTTAGLLAVTIDPATGEPTGRGVVEGLGERTRVIGSPLSLSDGRLLFVAGDAKGSSLALAEVGEGYAAAVHAIETPGGYAGEPSVAWDYQRAVRVAWTDARRRQAFIAESPLIDPASGGRTRPMYTAPGPIVALQLHTEAGVFLGEYEPGTPAEQIQAPPAKTSFWCVYEDRLNAGADDERVLWRGAYGSAALPDAGVAGSVEVTGLAEPRVIDRSLTMNGGLVMLVAEKSGDLHYADMAAGTIAPVREITGTPVTPESRPELVTAHGASPPWVYLRWSDKPNGRIAWAKLAPEEFEEPDQHGHSH
jgi:hypothetical protein